MVEAESLAKIHHHIAIKISPTDVHFRSSVVEAVKSGAHRDTMSYQVFLQMLNYLLMGMGRFLEDGESLQSGER